MNEPDFRRLDLNLLRILLALIEEGSVTAAGEKLGLAQSTVSHALARLRESFNDPMFVRSSQGVQATAFAVALAPSISKAFEIIRDGIDGHLDFDPSRSRRSFVLLMTDIGEMLLAPRLIARLRDSAPNIRLIFKQLARELHREALESGEADLAVGQMPDVHSDFVQQRLSGDGFLGFARKGHPILADPSLENFLNASHLVVGYPSVSEAHLKKALGTMIFKQKIAVQIGHFLPASSILMDSDLIAVLPRAMSAYLTAPGDIESFIVPFEIEPVSMHQFWHPRSTNDEGHKWLRAQIASIFQQFGAVEAPVGAVCGS